MLKVKSVKTSAKGISLIEVVIYIALFALLTAGFISFSLSTTGLYVRVKSMEEVLSSTRQIERVVNFYIKDESLSVVYPLSTQASSSLEVRLRGESRGIFYLDNGRLMFQIGSASPWAITSNEVVVRNLSFNNYSSSQDFASLRMTCLISFVATDSLEYTYNYNFSMTVNTRN